MDEGQFQSALTAVRQQVQAQQMTASLPASMPVPPPQPVEEQEDLEKLKKKQELSQQDKRFAQEMEQRKMDRELKKAIATLVFRFLAVETLGLFFVILLQGFAPMKFHLEDSTINIFLGATLLQISSMAVIITRHLYPTSGN